MLVDLHVHTPASACYKGKNGEEIAGQIIENAKNTGLEMIAITDHHTAGWVDIMSAASLATGFPVIPGVEVSFRTKEAPTVYFLALFPEDTKGAAIDSLMDKLGVPEESKGHCGYRVDKPLEFFIKETEELGGVLISDHMDKTEERRIFLPILLERYGIKLFEWKNQSYDDEFKLIAKNNSFHSFTFSDSHSPSTVGAKKTELPLETPSFGSFLKFAEIF